MSALVITAANVLKITGQPKQGTALSTITAGQALYKDGTLGIYGDNMAPADANGTALLRTTVGVSLHAALAGQPILYMGNDGDVMSFGAILTANVCYIAGAVTPGDINPIADITTGWFLSSIGFATSTSLMTLKFFASGVAN